MKKGDKIRLIDEKGFFIVQQIQEKKVVLLDEYGFENSYSLSKVVPSSELEYLVPDFNSNEVISEKQSIDKKHKKQKSSIKKGLETREVDLHIGHLVDSFKGLEPHQMLQKQLNVARIEIEKARKDTIGKLILIHGKGKGVLKNELYKILDSIPHIEYWEADIIKYRLGAVEIRFK